MSIPKTVDHIAASRLAIEAAEVRVTRWQNDYSPRGRRCYGSALLARAVAVGRLERAEAAVLPKK